MTCSKKCDPAALSLVFQGKYEEAEPLYQRSLAIDENVYGPDHLEVALDLNNWAWLLEKKVRAVRNFQENSSGVTSLLVWLNNRAGLL